MKMKLSALALMVAGATLMGCSNQPDPAVHGVDLTVMHTNDNHGRFWKNKNGEYGMAARKTLIENIREEVEDNYGYSLLFSGGDINTGVPESDMQDAEPDFKGMNALGYDAMAVGNHEFDNPREVLLKQASWANFPFLAANIYKKGSNERLFQPYKIFTQGGVKIAVIGLTTEDTYKIGNPEYMEDLDFRNPVKELKALIPQIKQTEKPDLIFAITHMGHYQNAEYGVNAPGDVTLARSLPKGSLDMIIGGHSQNPVCMNAEGTAYDENFEPGKACRPDNQNGTWIVQAHEWGKYVGRADFNFKDGKLTLKDYQLIPVNLGKKEKVDGKKVFKLIGERIPEDKKVLKLLKPYQEKGEKALEVIVGEVNGKLVGDRNVVRFKQTNLGNLIATAQAEKVNADFGIMNSGGVRDSIQEGKVSYKDVLIVHPFGNIVAKVSMTGKELIKYLNVVATKSIDSGAYPQFSSHIAMTVKKDGVHNVKINGKPVKANKMYSFSVPHFNAIGGDGYPKLTKFINTGFVDADVLKEYLEKHRPLDVKKFEPKNNIIFKNH